MNNIEIENISGDKSLNHIEIVMKDQTQDNFNDKNFKIIVNLHPNKAAR